MCPPNATKEFILKWKQVAPVRGVFIGGMERAIIKFEWIVMNVFSECNQITLSGFLSRCKMFFFFFLHSNSVVCSQKVTETGSTTKACYIETNTHTLPIVPPAILHWTCEPLQSYIWVLGRGLGRERHLDLVMRVLDACVLLFLHTFLDHVVLNSSLRSSPGYLSACFSSARV